VNNQDVYQLQIIPVDLLGFTSKAGGLSNALTFDVNKKIAIRIVPNYCRDLDVESISPEA
jgi:hypothetical protein